MTNRCRRWQNAAGHSSLNEYRCEYTGACNDHSLKTMKVMTISSPKSLGNLAQFSTSYHHVTCRPPNMIAPRLGEHSGDRQFAFPPVIHLLELRRISSPRRNHSQRVSKYWPARRTISCHRILINIGLAGLQRETAKSSHYDHSTTYLTCQHFLEQLSNSSL